MSRQQHRSTEALQIEREVEVEGEGEREGEGPGEREGEGERDSVLWNTKHLMNHGENVSSYNKYSHDNIADYIYDGKSLSIWRSNSWKATPISNSNIHRWLEAQQRKTVVN